MIRQFFVQVGSRTFTTFTSVVCSLVVGCSTSTPPDEPAQAGYKANREGALKRFPPASADHFHGMDQVVDVEKGELRDIELSDEDIKGRNAWVLWTGGNEAFWDWLARNGYGTIDLLQVVDSRQRGSRFARAGMINEPGTRPSTDEEAKEAYGVYYDRLDSSSPYAGNYSKAGESGPPDPTVYGYSTGVVGLRLFQNPHFKGAAKRRWDSKRYYTDADYAARPDTIRPFRVGMTCAFCHVAPHPLNPPTDVENPHWENLSSTIGNQYLRVRETFGNQLEPDNYFYHVLDSQLPGTIDTSLIASDNINNANTMNAIFGLGWRVRRALHNPAEALSIESENYAGVWGESPYPDFFPEDIRQGYDQLEDNPRAVPRVLVDGSDSVGSWVALARVYFNIGSYHQNWVRLHNTILGFRKQQPFKLADAETNSVNWHGTLLRVDPMTSFFLKSSHPMKLQHTRANPERYTPVDSPIDENLSQGRQVFSQSCIACHSSVQPGDDPVLEAMIANGIASDLTRDKGLPPELRDAEQNASLAELAKRLRLTMADRWELTRGSGKLPDGYQAWASEAIKYVRFWDENYLSADIRIPVTMVRTNSARAMATNALHGNLWEDFASLTYKELDSVGRVSYRDPFSKAEKSFEAPDGGPGYYRVPTLIGSWATAPFFHNNSLGDFNNDPSFDGRLDAFDDAIHKLLWPEQRFNHDRHSLSDSELVEATDYVNDSGLIWRTSADSYLVIRNHQIPSTLYGLTGWSRASLKVLPWIPAFIAMVVGLALLFNDAIRDVLSRVRRKFAWLESVLSAGQWIIAGLLLLSAIGIVALLVKNFWTIRIWEQVLEWKGPWVEIQGVLLSVLLAFVAYWVLHDKLPGPRFQKRFAIYAGAASFVIAVIFVAGIGMFLTGHGGSIKVGPFPKGMPVNLVANVDPESSLADKLAAGEALLPYLHEARRRGREPGGDSPPSRTLLKMFEQDVAPSLMKISKCPDLVMDRGHDYVFLRNMDDEQKAALIELIKTF